MKFERKVEYRVREVKRYVVTRYVESGKMSVCHTHGEFASPRTAQLSARALGRLEELDCQGDPAVEVLYPEPLQTEETEVESEDVAASD